jgi:thioester reductase-like protein
MRETVTHIFHVAYPLNFNLGVQAFEPQVAFVRSLVDFAAQSSLLQVKPRITFASSAGSLQNWRQDGEVPEVQVNVETAVGTGYGESKRVCELVREEPLLHVRGACCSD